MLLKTLESESIYIIREVAASYKKAGILYSAGKDSAVLLHLARKAFYPGTIPFPVLHIDTTWKFKEMISFRDEIVKKFDLNLIVHTNPEGIRDKVNPFDWSSSDYTYIMKTAALRQTLDKHDIEVAIGGARRDEEKSRAKEKIFSIRSSDHTWDPKNQRPEFWDNYNTFITPEQSLRVFPLSNWTEIDIWKYIEKENIPICPLYFAKERPIIREKDSIIMVDDDRLPLNGKTIENCMIRFRTLGCYPLTQPVESQASNIQEIIQEIIEGKKSERCGRMIDHDDDSGLEKKKREGYF